MRMSLATDATASHTHSVRYIPATWTRKKKSGGREVMWGGRPGTYWIWFYVIIRHFIFDISFFTFFVMVQELVKMATIYTWIQKYLNICQRDENTEMLNIFDHFRGTPPPDLTPPPWRRPHPPWWICCHHGSKSLFGCVHKYLDTFSCCCNFPNSAATWTVSTSLESLKSQQLNLLHSFLEKLHIKGHWPFCQCSYLVYCTKEHCAQLHSYWSYTNYT